MTPSVTHVSSYSVLLSAAMTFVLIFSSDSEARTRRDVWVKPGPAGGDGTRAAPYGSIQEAIDRHDKDWGQVFVCPGVYKEDVVIERDGMWFFPALQYDVIVEGSFTIRGDGIALRGFTFRGRKKAIVAAAGVKDCYVQNNRVLDLADGGVGIDVEGSALVCGNVVDLRRSEAKDTTGLRVVCQPKGQSIRVDHNRVAGADRGIVIADAGEASSGPSYFTNNEVKECRIGLEVLAQGSIVKYNRVSSCVASGLIASGRGAEIACNTIFRNGSEGARIAGPDIKLTSNVLFGNASAGAAVSAGATNVAVRRNTFHANSPESGGSLLTSDGTSGVIAGNIFSGARGLLKVAGVWEINGNLLSHPGVENKGSEAVVGDPMFVRPDIGDFHLRPGSPAIGAAPASAESQQDRDGVGRPTSGRSDIGAFVFPKGVASQRVIYVAADAKKDGDGSKQRPYATIAQAVRGLEPGDTVVVADGSYSENATITRSGTPAGAIVVRSESPHGAIISQARITLDDCTYVRIEGFLFRSCPGGVVFGPNAQHNTVSGCRLSTLAGKPNSTISVSGPSASNNVIEDCVFEGEGRKQVAIQLACQHWNQHCIIRRTTISGYYYAVQTGGGSYPTAPPGYHIVEDCELFDNKDGVHSKMTDGIIRNNHLHHNTGHGITVRYGARQLIEGNRIHHNGRGIRLHSPSHLVRNNVIYSNKNGGIILTVIMGEPYYEPPTSNFIVNNTLWRNGRTAIRIEQGARCALMRNIIVGASPTQWLILREDTDSKAPGEISGAIRMADFNLYYNGRVPLLTEHEGGEHILNTDPMFVAPDKDDFRLAKDSPALSAIPADWTSLPPIPFGADADDRWRTLGATPDVARPDRSYGVRP